MIIPLWHQRPGRAPLAAAIWLSHTTLGYTVAHSAIDWGVEGQLFSTSEQQVLLSNCPFSCLVSVLPKNVSYLSPSACWFKPNGIWPRSPHNTPSCSRCSRDRRTSCNWDLIGDVTLVLFAEKRAFKNKKSASMQESLGRICCQGKKSHFLPNMFSRVCTKRLTGENKALHSISLNPALSPDYILISASILLPLLLLLVKQAW